jgi:MFS family permease
MSVIIRRNEVAPQFVPGLGLLFGIMYFVQSLGDPSSGLVAQPVRSLLRAGGESPAAIAGFMALAAIPWSLKPLLALLSDFVPLKGSRRRTYLLLATAASCAGLVLLYALPVSAAQRTLLLLLVWLPGLGIAFGDVLVDALMIEIGQPRGLTGKLQSVQWSAAYAALILSGTLGGYLSTVSGQQYAFLTCAVLWGGAFVLAAKFIREPPSTLDQANLAATARSLRGALAVPGLLILCVFVFFWDFNPLWVSVLYLHITDTLGFSEQVYGNAYSLFSVGALVASIAYGFYCRRVRAGHLMHVSIAAGIAANLVYWSLPTIMATYAVSLLAGLAYMTGSLILLDVAARLVPARVAATVFAVIMALANLGSSIAEAGGGYLFELLGDRFDPMTAYRSVVAVSAAIVAGCWWLLPRLRRAVPEWWHRPSSPGDALLVAAASGRDEA